MIHAVFKLQTIGILSPDIICHQLGLVMFHTIINSVYPRCKAASVHVDCVPDLPQTA